MIRRRTLIHGSTVAIAGVLTGYSTIQSVFDEGPSVEEVKKNSKLIEYEELRENIGQYEGTYVHFPAADALAVVDNYGTYEYVFSLPGGEEKILYGVWSGDPYDPNNTMEIWGIVQGSVTESYFTKNEKRVPKIELVDIRLL